MSPDPSSLDDEFANVRSEPLRHFLKNPQESVIVVRIILCS